MSVGLFHRVILTQRLEKWVDLTVLYGSITPNTPNGTFCPLLAVFTRGRFDVLFIHTAVVMTRYICEVVIVAGVEVLVEAVPLAPSAKREKERKASFTPLNRSLC